MIPIVEDVVRFLIIALTFSRILPDQQVTRTSGSAMS